MNKKFIPFFLLLFIFIGINFVSAVGSISGLPNINQQYNDYDEFDIDSYATGHNNSYTYLTFTNPQTGGGVTLYGTGGTHSNNRFSITLNPSGLVQIASNEIEMANRNIQICVSSVQYQTQSCDSFSLSIHQNLAPTQFTSFNNYNLTNAGGSITLNLNNFFTEFTTFNIGYSDPITSQSVSITRSTGQGATSYTGGIITTASFSSGIPQLYFQSNSNTFNQKMTLNVSNQFGSAVATFNVSSTTTAINITPQQTGSYLREYNKKVGETHVFKVSDFFSGYTLFTGFAYYTNNTQITGGSYICKSNGLETNIYPESSANPLFTVTKLGNNTGDYILFNSNIEADTIIFFYPQNVNGLCNYNGGSNFPFPGGTQNYTVHFSNNAITTNQTSNTFIDKWVNFMNNWFPDESELTLKQKWTYTFFTILLLNAFVFLILAISTKGQINFRFGIFLGLFLSGLSFAWFIAIGYISVTIVVIFTLLIALFMFMRSRG